MTTTQDIIGLTIELRKAADVLSELSDERDQLRATVYTDNSATIANMQAEIERCKSAVRTLEKIGYTNNGGELWKPLVGKAPDFGLIDSLRAERDALIAENDKLSDLWSVMKAERDALQAHANALRTMARHNINVSYRENINGAFVVAEHAGIDFCAESLDGPHEDDATAMAINRAAAALGEVKL